MNKSQTELAEELYRDVLSLVKSFSEGQAEKRLFENLLLRKLCAAGIRLMANASSSAEARSAAYLLSRNALLSASLVDTTHCSTEEAIAAAHTALKAGVQLHSGLARALNGALQQEPSFENVARILRILDLFGAISGCCNSSRMELMAYPDKKVQSRAALLIGRAVQNPVWLSRCFKDGDARVQASAVEAMWDMPTDRARPLLTAAAKSSNNRVVANALVGLHHHGDMTAIPCLLEMAQHPEPSFRISAIWAMGQDRGLALCSLLNTTIQTIRGQDASGGHARIGSNPAARESRRKRTSRTAAMNVIGRPD